MIQGESYTVHIGNNLDILPTLPDNSVDSIVTDPPYELGFMGKKWDSSGIAYSVELWRECLRVLKPGGHLLSFGGTRTWHRVAVGIEDAGFEVRDSIAWMYGSGFPKSLDVSKAIDKRDGESIGWFGEWLRAWRKQNNISQKKVAALFPSKSGNLTGCVANWELGLNLPTAEQFTIICRHFNLPFESIEEAQREVIGSKMSGIANKDQKERHTIGASKAIQVDITAPATPEAQQWQGWGTALKPAFEPIVVARKPLIGTVAENVLTHGTGALNIDGSRIATDEVITNHSRSADSAISKGKYGDSSAQETHQTDGQKLGRWPANVILDEYSAELLDEQSGVSKSPKTYTRNVSIERNIVGAYIIGEEAGTESKNYGDTGGASRFYYVAKASKRDRNEGLEELPLRKSDQRSEVAAGLWAEMEAPKQNFHPTVKPTQLMRYLVKLVTPPGGTVLDPFTGSGSTGKAAILEGFRFIGCELTEDYIPIIEGRLKHAESMAAAAETKKDEALF
jgi:DNA modification methylase